MPNNKALMILGMHRSGTSMLASWLHHCGLNLGERLLGSGVGNLRGHFEDWDFIELHEQMLKQVRIRSGGLRNIKKASLLDNGATENKIREILQVKSARGIDWGWKDPRTCLFLPTYKRCISGTKVIAIFRPPMEVVDSLIRREEGKLDKRLSKRYKENSLIRRSYYQFRKLVFSKYLRRFKAKYFLECWIAYNVLIISFLSGMDKEEFLLVSTKKIMENEDSISRTINSWGFSLEKKPMSTVVDKAIMKNSPMKIETLDMERAEIIEAELEELASY
ncbi:MAG: hypothetical protein KBT63_06655 [Porticoccaceae bacterium]|nr:hypothetical protein [Porticoccaceae bacterium]